MSININRIQVKNLFNKFDINVPIKDNTLILVGENGTGKSTLINLLYFALTSQWTRLANLPFQSFTITIDEKDYEIFRDSLNSLKASKTAPVFSFFQRKLHEDDLNSLLIQLAEHESEYWSTPEGFKELRDLSKTYTASIGSLSRRIPHNAFVDLAKLNPFYNSLDSGESSEAGLRDLSKRLSLNSDEQILFLPTYRRIEKELSDLFPELTSEDISFAATSKNNRIDQQGGYIELVEFGMTDVSNAFDSTLKKLDQSFRSELNRLTGSYLHDILQERYNDVHVSSLLTGEAAEAVELMLSRIDEEILSEADRGELKKLLAGIKSKDDGDLDVKERISAHFLNSLLRIHKLQQEREVPVRKLVSLVNKYLNNKQLEFDSAAFKISIKRQVSEGYIEVPLHDLSSGEKQIVSLFSHLFLSGCDNHFVVIDEPELSISVPWQRRFLQDLKDTGRCSGLIAVTHSPFVFENSLSEFSHSINEFFLER